MDLDNPIWAALSSRQSDFAESNARARRMLPDVGPFAGFAQPTAEAWADLALQQPGAATVLFSDEAFTAPAGWRVLAEFRLPQMVLDAPPPMAREVAFTALGAADAPAMCALTKLTQPGPFLVRTHELGTYLGVKREGKLLAMAGERLQPPGCTEISAVCTHPDAVGHGYASALVAELARRILARGERPFLHVRPENARAIAVYERLGFRERRQLHVQVVRH